MVLSNDFVKLSLVFDSREKKERRKGGRDREIGIERILYNLQFSARACQAIVLSGGPILKFPLIKGSGSGCKEKC